MRCGTCALTFLAVLALSGCGNLRAGDLAAESAPRPTASSGREIQPCAQVAQLGLPITERQVADGCLETDGTVAPISPYLCRGSGDTVVELQGHRLVGDPLAFPVDTERSAPPSTVYGIWSTPSEYLPSGDIDINGCDWGDWPDPVDTPG